MNSVKTALCMKQVNGVEGRLRVLVVHLDAANFSPNITSTVLILFYLLFSFSGVCDHLFAFTTFFRRLLPIPQEEVLSSFAW